MMRPATRANALKKRLILACALVAATVPVMLAEAPAVAQVAGVDASTMADRQGGALGFTPYSATPFRVLEGASQDDEWGQVRIRQRVIIRVSPSPPDARERMLGLAPQRAQTQIREVPHDNCVAVDDIVGVQPTQDNRLLLFMENRQVLAASLDNSCTARAFYSGFYVEQNDDGRLCVSRDQLQSRAGVTCSVEQLTRLVPVGT